MVLSLAKLTVASNGIVLDTLCQSAIVNIPTDLVDTLRILTMYLVTCNLYPTERQQRVSCYYVVKKGREISYQFRLCCCIIFKLIIRRFALCHTVYSFPGTCVCLLIVCKLVDGEDVLLYKITP